ncbi:MAG: hypothetical protein ACI8W7_003247, partial [Gammaproteobacteria bacterium]
MHSDFSDLLADFNAHNVEYLVVGAHALAAHGVVRATKDMDIWVNPTLENAARVLRAIVKFGAPLHDLIALDLATKGIVFQIGVAPIRIDIITAIDGLEFIDAWQSKVVTRFGEESAAVISKDHLIVNKKATGRLQDLADVESLEGLDNANN